MPRTRKIDRDDNWKKLGASEKKLHPILNRVAHLQDAGLTVEMVGADFLRCRIAPLQQRDMPTWMYQNAGDIMRLFPGHGCNLTVLGHSWLYQQLFHKLGTFHLLDTVVPLHINTERSEILAWMPDYSAVGVKESWELQSLSDEKRWACELVEKAEREEGDLVKETTEEEKAYIANRLAEARRVALAKPAAPAKDTKEDVEE